MRRLIFALLLMFCLTLPGTAGADPPPVPPDADMGVIPKSAIHPDGYQPLYDRHGVTAYTWDDDLKWYKNPVSNAATILPNLFMILTALIVRLAIWLMEWAYTMPLIPAMITFLHQVLEGMRIYLWQSRLIHIALVVVGMYAAWHGLLMRRTGQAVAALTNALIVLMLASFIFGGGLTWAMRFVDDAATEISSGILVAVAGTTHEAPPGTEWAASRAFVAGGEAIWRTFVIVPWASGEFNGKLSTAYQYSTYGVPGDMVLGKSEEARRDVYQKAANKDEDFAWWRDKYAPVYRTVLGLVVLVVGVIFSAIIMALSGAVIAFKLAAVLLAAAVVLMLLVALFWPGLGMMYLARWSVRLFGFLISSIGVSAMLSVIVMASSIVYSIGARFGWAAGAGLQVLLVLALVINYKSLLGAIAAMPSSPALAMDRIREWRGGEGYRTVAGGISSGMERIRDWRDRREATQTMNQRLAADQRRVQDLRAQGKEVQPTELMRRADERMRRGARQPWTEGELRAEAARNRQLREIGADPLAIPADGATEPEYQSEVEKVRAANEETSRRLQTMQRQSGSRVRHQQWERSPIGRAVRYASGRRWGTWAPPSGGRYEGPGAESEHAAPGDEPPATEAVHADPRPPAPRPARKLRPPMARQDAEVDQPTRQRAASQVATGQHAGGQSHAASQAAQWAKLQDRAARQSARAARQMTQAADRVERAASKARGDES